MVLEQSGLQAVSEGCSYHLLSIPSSWCGASRGKEKATFHKAGRAGSLLTLTCACWESLQQACPALCCNVRHSAIHAGRSPAATCGCSNLRASRQLYLCSHQPVLSALGQDLFCLCTHSGAHVRCLALSRGSEVLLQCEAAIPAVSRPWGHSMAWGQGHSKPSGQRQKNHWHLHPSAKAAASPTPQGWHHTRALAPTLPSALFVVCKTEWCRQPRALLNPPLQPAHTQQDLTPLPVAPSPSESHQQLLSWPSQEAAGGSRAGPKAPLCATPPAAPAPARSASACSTAGGVTPQGGKAARAQGGSGRDCNSRFWVQALCKADATVSAIFSLPLKV